MSQITCNMATVFILGTVSNTALAQDAPALGHRGYDLENSSTFTQERAQKNDSANVNREVVSIKQRRAI